MSERKSISIRFDVDEQQTLLREAQADRRPVAGLIRKIVLDHLAAKRERTEAAA